MRRLVTLDGALPIKPGTQHPPTKEEHAQRQQDTDCKAKTPHCLEVLRPNRREHDQEYGNDQYTTKLIQRCTVEPKSLNEKNAGVTERTRVVTMMITANNGQHGEDGEYMGITWPAALGGLFVRRFARARRRGGVFSTDTLQPSTTKTSMETRVTYYAGDASRDGQEPKETGCTSIEAMSYSSKSCTKNNERRGAHEGHLAAHSVTNKTNDELPDDIT